MSLYIGNPEAKRLAAELAERTGETLTTAVIAALRERLAHIPRTKREIDQRRARLSKIVEAGQIARLRGQVGSKTDEELYDDQGLPA